MKKHNIAMGLFMLVLCLRWQMVAKLETLGAFCFLVLTFVVPTLYFIL
jgi:hypothetical protein